MTHDPNHDRSPFIEGRDDALMNRALDFHRYGDRHDQASYQLGFDLEVNDMIDVMDAFHMANERAK